ncbi:MAG: hypothetical protein ACK5EG_06915 [Chitinophagaceae bacterium]
MKNIAEMFEGPAHNLVWKNRFNEIIDEVYQKYDELFDSYYPPFSAPYPKRLTKEELVEEIKNGGKVIQEYELGVKIVERVLSIEERLDLASKTYSVFDPFDFYEVSHKEIDKLYPVPSNEIKLEYKNETVSYYE